MESEPDEPTIISLYDTEGILRLMYRYGLLLILWVTLILAFNWLTLSFAAVMVYGFWYFQMIRRIVVGPQHLKIYYFIGRTEIINYLDIKAIRTKRGMGRRGSSGCERQELELADKNYIEFNEGDFSNFNDLKRYIWNYRLKAFEDQRNNESSN